MAKTKSVPAKPVETRTESFLRRDERVKAKEQNKTEESK